MGVTTTSSFVSTLPGPAALLVAPALERAVGLMAASWVVSLRARPWRFDPCVAPVRPPGESPGLGCSESHVEFGEEVDGAGTANTMPLPRQRGGDFPRAVLHFDPCR